MSADEETAAGNHPWFRLMALRIGVIPAPVAVLLAVLLWALTALDKLPSDIMANIAILGLGGFACAEVGRRIPLMRQMGAAAIFATFAPSWLVYAHLAPDAVVESVATFTKSSNFLYLFISTIVVGSIFGMDRRVLVSGFLKIFPLTSRRFSAARCLQGRERC